MSLHNEKEKIKKQNEEEGKAGRDATKRDKINESQVVALENKKKKQKITFNGKGNSLRKIIIIAKKKKKIN